MDPAQCPKHVDTYFQFTMGVQVCDQRQAKHMATEFPRSLEKEQDALCMVEKMKTQGSAHGNNRKVNVRALERIQKFREDEVFF